MYNKRTFEVNEEQTAAFLENAVNNVKTDVDVESLAVLVKLYKKNVPFSLRKYVAAYLLREALKHDHSFRPGRFEKNRNKKNESRENFMRGENKKNLKTTETEKTPAVAAEERQPHPLVDIPEDQATTIVSSIGRNRRVFPRDLVSLLINVGGLDRERIGNIKILANYSFVQLYSEDTDKAIAALNEYEYRGRKLVVNLSRQKGDSEEEIPSDENVESQSENEEYAMSAEDAAAYAAAEKAVNNEPFGNA